MKRILYLSFYFEPDLCAGSFRNSPLVKELAEKINKDTKIDVMTTLPNRYNTIQINAAGFEDKGNYQINRIQIPIHNSGMKDQINSFKSYFQAVKRLTKGRKYDLVVASSSRLFTAYLGYTIAKSQKIPLYLDVRDIFTDTMKDVLTSRVVKALSLPILSIIERKVFNYASHINLISEGFKPYFDKFEGPNYSFFSNGIDNSFLDLPVSTEKKQSNQRIITYAGNIGEGQGLHKIIPQAAKELGSAYKFVVIGDGGAKSKLVSELDRFKLTNVEMRNPVSRKELLEIYSDSDFLFIHLNDYDAFKKVLPSKVFELGAFDKPIIAGVAGYAHKFIDENVPNRILFLPGDAKEMVRQLEEYKYTTLVRKEFVEKYKRSNLDRSLVKSILSYL